MILSEPALESFRSRNGLKFKLICGEAATVREETVDMIGPSVLKVWYGMCSYQSYLIYVH